MVNSFNFEIVKYEENKVTEALNNNSYVMPELNLQKYERMELESDKQLNNQTLIYQEKVDYQPHALISEISTNIDALEQTVVSKKTSKQRVEYKARCNDRLVISEIILWKIVSDSAGEGAHNNKIETKQIRYINFMKGENRI